MTAGNSDAKAHDFRSELTPGTRCVTLLENIYRDEMLAVETYELALRETRLGSALQQEFSRQSSHRDRLVAVEQRIAQRGAECPDSSDGQGFLVILLDGAAVSASDQAAVDVLRQWETQKLSDYQAQHDALDAQDADFVFGELLPAQVASHRIVVQVSGRLHGRDAAMPVSERG